MVSARLEKQRHRYASWASCLLVVFTLMLGSGCQKKPDQETPRQHVQIVKTKTGIAMVLIPAGWFQMGSEAGSADETPVHQVYLDAFLMDQHEVTQEQYSAFPLPDPSHFKNPQHPVEQINWTDALAYCNERSLAENLTACYDIETGECNFQTDGYRLPTEAEWEYACRAGSQTEFAHGNDTRRLQAEAWYKENAHQKTEPVARKQPNSWGLYDMHGNVREWCNDYYRETYYQHSPEKNPRGPEQGSERIIRGGGWDSRADSCRSSYRAADASINDTCLASDAIGFRCVRNMPPNAQTSEASQTPIPRETPLPTDATEPISKTGFLYHDIYLNHDTGPGHPEKPARLTAIVNQLRQTGLTRQLVMLGPPQPVDREWLIAVHTPEYVQRAQACFSLGMRFLDSPDVPISEHSYDVATQAAGGVLEAVDAVMQGRITNAFCAVRPPGHHALADQAMGFCIFNNLAVGVRYAQQKHGLARILIVDWDVHHGNGTQAAFYDDPNILYFSVHQYPFYPGSGSKAEKGSGAGLNYNINVPLPAGSGDADYLRVFEERLEPVALSFLPEFVFISAGFDAHKDDPLGGMKVTAEGFARLTQSVQAIARKCCDGRLVSVLEGGYGLEGLAASVEAHIRVLMR